MESIRLSAPAAKNPQPTNQHELLKLQQVVRHELPPNHLSSWIFFKANWREADLFSAGKPPSNGAGWFDPNLPNFRAD